ncbi:cytochrome P450 4C1 isoform X2 [Anabrus simplex]|uniref:cytochrome P450 4C1 isoform X2 n=1 Tax=Anabrus simplex TaxID=316456 RepID=UPI0035A3CC31
MWEVVLWPFIALALFWLLILLIYPYNYVPFRYSELNKIPGPKGYPIIGNFWIFLTTSSAEFFPLIKEMNDKYGPILRFHGFGRNDIVINDLDVIEKLLSSTRYIKKSGDYNFLTPWLREGLLTSTGSKWHSRRKLLTPTFHFKILDYYMPVLIRNTDIFIEKLREHMDEPFIRINNFTTLLTLDIISETAMGVKINAQEDKEVEYVKAVHRMSEIFQLRQLTIRLHRDSIFQLSPIGREQTKLLKTLQGFTRKIIEERREEYKTLKNGLSDSNGKATKRRHLAFLDQLIEISEREGNLTDLDIQEEVDTFMFEGHDTTSAALSWAMYLLGAHPNIQEKVVEELNDIFGDSYRPPGSEDLARMKYLEQVIKEALRIYPSVPAFGRKLETEIEARQRFAMMEEKVVLSTVLRNFKLESLDKPKDIVPLGELITRPKDPLRIRFRTR